MSKKEVLNNFLEIATKKWGVEAKKLQRTLKIVADATWKIEDFPLKPDEEPAISTTVLLQRKYNELRNEEE